MKNVIQKLREGIKVPYYDLRDALIPSFPMLADLEGTPQDPVWHAEGNVEIHTRNVTHLMYDYLDELGIKEGDERAALILAAVFHDVAKPVTTRSREKDGRTQIIAPRHAERGRSYIAYRVLQLGLSYEMTHTLLNVVGLHHEPKWMVIKEKGPGAYAYLSQKVNPKYLWALEMADMYGRECEDQKEQVEQIEMFKLYCEEYGVWDNDPFSNWSEVIRAKTREWHSDKNFDFFVEKALTSGMWDYRDGSIWTPEEAASKGMASGKEFSNLYVLCGPSGSGKSTYVRDHLGHCNIVSMDRIREEITGDPLDQTQNGKVLQASKERLKESLRESQDVVWDTTGLRKDFRNLPFRIGMDYGAHTTLIVFHMEPDKFKDRNLDRKQSVPPHVLDKQLQSSQFPYEYDEAHRTLFVGTEGNILRDTRNHYDFHPQRQNKAHNVPEE